MHPATSESSNLLAINFASTSTPPAGAIKRPAAWSSVVFALAYFITKLEVSRQAVRREQVSVSGTLSPSTLSFLKVRL